MCTTLSWEQDNNVPGRVFKSLKQVSTDWLDWPILKPVSYTHLDVYKRQHRRPSSVETRSTKNCRPNPTRAILLQYESRCKQPAAAQRPGSFPIWIMLSPAVRPWLRNRKPLMLNRSASALSLWSHICPKETVAEIYQRVMERACLLYTSRCV